LIKLPLASSIKGVSKLKAPFLKKCQSSLAADHFFMQLHPVIITAKRFIKIRIGDLSAIAVYPAGKHGKIIQEFRKEAKGDEKYANT
jgi:hypothetical protein